MNETSCPYEVSVEVTFRDIDAMGHVNNAVFFTYMETARIKYVMDIFGHQHLLELDLPLILVRAACTYHSPALLGERLTIGLGVSRFGRKSFDLTYRMLGQDGRLVATGTTVQVMYDYSGRSAYEIPEALKERVRDFQGAWQPPTGDAQ